MKTARIWAWAPKHSDYRAQVLGPMWVGGAGAQPSLEGRWGLAGQGRRGLLERGLTRSLDVSL